MKAPVLTPRLKAAAAYVRAGKRAADIGTDHAYLPCYLTATGICPKAVAADIAKGPLSLAEKSVVSYGLSDKIKLILSDGLLNISPEDCEEIIIAGMGAETIQSILDSAPFIQNPEIHLILQPMTKMELLRKYLCESGFYIEDETAVREGNKSYTVLSVYYRGETIYTDEVFYYTGKLKNKTDSDSVFYKNKISDALEKQAEGLLKQDIHSHKAGDLKKLAEQIRG